MWGGVQWAGSPWAGVPEFAQVVYGSVACAVVAVTGLVDAVESAAAACGETALVAAVVGAVASPLVQGSDEGAVVCGVDGLRQGV